MNALPLALALALGATPSSSKLGVVSLGSPVVDARDQVLRACPRVIVWNVDGNQTAAIRASKMACPSSIAVARVPLAIGTHFTVDQDAASAGSSAAGTVRDALILYGIQSTEVDWVLGPDPDNMPSWSARTMPSWAATFWGKYADELNLAGYHPVIGALGAGDPPLKGEVSTGSANGFAETAGAMKSKTYPWAWSYRAQPPGLDAFADPKANDSLRYRAIRDECGLRQRTLLIDAAGVRSVDGRGWKALSIDSGAYVRWMHWLDMETRLDSEVIGAAMFQFGDSGMNSEFALDSLADDFVQELGDDSVPDGGLGPPDGEDAGPPDNTVPPDDTEGLPVPPLKGCGCTAAGAVGPTLALAGLLGLLVRRTRARAYSASRR